MKMFAILAGCVAVAAGGAYGLYQYTTPKDVPGSCPVATSGGCCPTDEPSCGTPSESGIIGDVCCYGATQVSASVSTKPDCCALATDCCAVPNPASLIGAAGVTGVVKAKPADDCEEFCEFCASPTNTISRAAKAIATPK